METHFMENSFKSQAVFKIHRNPQARTPLTHA